MAACEHGQEEKPFTVTVSGHQIEVTSSELCPACLETYLNRHCTLCATCGKPILPGDSVGQAPEGAPQPYTHLTNQCSPFGGVAFCGKWGEGRLVTLHEIDPTQFPPDTANLATHAVRVGGTLNVNLGPDGTVRSNRFE